MVDHNLDLLSESEEMYILTIENLQGDGEENRVSLSRLADQLAVQPVSANQMIHKLESSGYVEYQPYKGVKLSPTGEKQAEHILRHRRIWQTFLVERLGMSLAKADELACRFEHITPQEVIARLFQYLGDPAYAPDGKPIPPLEGSPAADSRSLVQLQAGSAAAVTHIEASPQVKDFLDHEGLRPGAEIVVLASSQEGAILVETPRAQLSLTKQVALQIFVSEQSPNHVLP